MRDVHQKDAEQRESANSVERGKCVPSTRTGRCGLGITGEMKWPMPTSTLLEAVEVWGWI